MPVFSFSLILRSSYHVSKNISLFKSIVIFSCLLAYKSFRQTKQSHAKASVKILQHGQLLCAVWSKATFLLLFLMKEQFFFFFKYQMSSNICVCVSTKVYCFSMQLVANLFACKLYTLSIENSSYLAWISPQLVLRPYLTHSLARLHSSTELHTQMYQFNYMQTYKIPIH